MPEPARPWQSSAASEGPEIDMGCGQLPPTWAAAPHLVEQLRPFEVHCLPPVRQAVQQARLWNHQSPSRVHGVANRLLVLRAGSVGRQEHQSLGGLIHAPHQLSCVPSLSPSPSPLSLRGMFPCDSAKQEMATGQQPADKGTRGPTHLLFSISEFPLHLHGIIKKGVRVGLRVQHDQTHFLMASNTEKASHLLNH